jgi:putative flavoprotein involved in K+ transport
VTVDELVLAGLRLTFSPFPPTVHNRPVNRATVAVVGAGPAGLAAAATLKQAGVAAVVLEQRSQVGASWRGHYDRLHLHTARTLSDLPGLSFPRRNGRWVPRDGVVSYLQDYAERNELEIRFDTAVRRIVRGNGGWVLPTEQGDQMESDQLEVEQVVMATGYNRRPFLPDWPGRDGYTGELVHAGSYGNSVPYQGKQVLVVGAGNSGAEIAVDLVEGGAAGVRLSVRTPAHVFPRQAFGVPSQAVGIVARHLPVAVADRLLATLQRVLVGDLSRHGMPKPKSRPYSDYLSRDVIPILDVGLVKLLKSRAVEVVSAVEAFDGARVMLSDGSTVTPDAVIAATGYRRDLEPLVGHLGVLEESGRPLVHGADTHPSAPGLYFVGFTNPLSGNLRELGIQARAIAKVVAAAQG